MLFMVKFVSKVRSLNKNPCYIYRLMYLANVYFLFRRHLPT